MTDETAHDRMQQYEELAAKEGAFRRRKGSVLDAVGDELAAAVESAVDDAGAAVEVTETSRDGTHQTLRARLDRAALVAAVADALPEGFVVEHVNEDGSLTVQWDEHDTVGPERHHGSILKAIVAEETVTDENGLITDVPTLERVLSRAESLGVDRDAAERRLDHLAELDVVDVAEGEVLPDTNFSKF